MSRFTKASNPALIPDSDAKWWEVTEEIDYRVGYVDSDLAVVVPKGFKSNGASVPSFLRWIFPKWGKYTKAVIVHDYLYRNPYLLNLESEEIITISREEADKIFFEAMGVLEVAEWRKVLMYQGVRTFGWLFFRG